MHKLVCCNVTQPIDKLRQARTDSCTLSSTFTALPHKRAHDSTCCRRRTRRMPRSPAVAPLPQSTHRSRQVAWQPLPPPSDTHSLPPAAVAGGFGWAGLRDGDAHALAACAMDAVQRGRCDVDAGRPRCLAADPGDPMAQGETAGRVFATPDGAAPAAGGSDRADEWMWEGPGPGPADDASDPFRAGW